MQFHIFSPYRVCPLGAHVDYQHGLVTGFAIDKGVDLWFDVREDSKVILDSEAFNGHVEFDIATPPLLNKGNWEGRLCAGGEDCTAEAVQSLTGHQRCHQGIASVGRGV